ncbi:3-keto-disaccharide hydrolase [Anatilimnocola floriformis]|uniref:3-keto-disaccharide hydrolase n=1 Tax=Anatilimnocola floriformis TaxID=2948575 RepID=UPI0020C48083|nr:DUF1080 domain-containing protein [Anatilimnocola floriformis]
MQKLMLAFFMLLAMGLPCGAEEWRALFNGKDLTGWRANNDPESFKVVDGVLRVQASGKTSAHLFVVDAEKKELERFKNFELEVVARAEPDSNGGIFVHTDMSTRDAQLHLAQGYEVQLNSSAKEKRKTGSLYAIVDRDESPVDETEWFTTKVVVRDKRITIAVNGKELVDYTEPADVERPKERAGRRFAADGNGIALQAHDAKSVWYFKEIRVRRLP